MSAIVADVSPYLYLALTVTGGLFWLGTLDRDVRTDLRIEGTNEIVVISREPYVWSMLGTRFLFVAFFSVIGMLTFQATSINTSLSVLAVAFAGLYALTGLRQLHLRTSRLKSAQGVLTSTAAVVTIAGGIERGLFVGPLTWLRQILLGT